MLNKNNWITLNKNISCYTFKRKIILKDNIKDAFINIAVMGWYHLYIDGIIVDKTFISQGYTDYRYRVQFQHYDIGEYLVDKKSAILEIELADGWAASEAFADVFKWGVKGPLAFPKSLNYELNIEYVNGEKDTLISDKNGEFYTNNVTFACIYNGEVQKFDNKIEYLGNPEYINIDSKIIPHEGTDIICGETFNVKKMFKAPNGDLIIDFGQNFVGYVQIKIKGKKGDVISYEPGEVLDNDGNLYRDNYRAAKSFYSFALSGKEDILVPRFSFMGGRYIRLVDYPTYITEENFIAVLVHSKMEQTCFFKCDNAKINRLYLNTYYGQLSNYLDIPTDCPQRDERLGWTADTQIFAKTAAIHFNVKQFFKKWLNDMKISQSEKGEIYPIIPYVMNSEYNISNGWSDAATVCPYEMYLAYDDKTFIYDYLEMMEKWVNFLKENQIKENIISLKFCFGDWLALDTVYVTDAYQGATRYDLIATAYYYYGVSKIIEFRKIIGKDVKEYEELLPKIKQSFINEFIKDGHMIGEKAFFESNKENEKTCYTQTGLAMTLFFDLCNEKDILSLTNDLVELISECNDRLTTGFIGTPYILEALAKNGRMDVAYKLLLSEKYPSWLYSVNKGATTMWEHWDGIKEDGSFWPVGMNSYNHYAYGSVFGFIFERVVGIKAIKPGYKEIIIEPHPNKLLGGVDTLFKSVNGDISVSWRYENNKIKYDISFNKEIEGKVIINGKEIEIKIENDKKVLRVETNE